MLFDAGLILLHSSSRFVVLAWLLTMPSDTLRCFLTLLDTLCRFCEGAWRFTVLFAGVFSLPFDASRRSESVWQIASLASAICCLVELGGALGTLG